MASTDPVICLGRIAVLSGANLGPSTGQMDSLGMGNGVPGCGPIETSSLMTVSSTTVAGVEGRVSCLGRRLGILKTLPATLALCLARLKVEVVGVSSDLRTTSAPLGIESFRHWLRNGSWKCRSISLGGGVLDVVNGALPRMNAKRTRVDISSPR